VSGESNHEPQATRHELSSGDVGYSHRSAGVVDGVGLDRDSCKGKI